MKIYVYLLLIIIFFSKCSKKEDDIILSNQLEICYKGYYEEINGFSYKTEIYTDFEIIHITEQISSTQEIKLLQITASSTEDDGYVLFKVYEDSIGNNVLYDNVFAFRTARGATYYPAELEFQVLTNNNINFSAEFSGTLKHYNQYEYYYIFMNIKFGTILVTH